MANVVSVKFKQIVGEGYDIANATLKVMLLSGYTPTSAMDYVSEFSAYEVDGVGYERKTLTNVELFRDNTNGVMTLSADDVTWSAANFNADGAVLFNYNSSGDAYSEFMIYFDFGGNQESQNTPFVIEWSDAEGILRYR